MTYNFTCNLLNNKLTMRVNSDDKFIKRKFIKRLENKSLSKNLLCGFKDILEIHEFLKEK